MLRRFVKFTKMNDHAPCKLFIGDLSKCNKIENSPNWILKLNADNRKTKNLTMHTIWIQGKIDTVIENADKIIVLLKDGTGAAKVTHVGAVELANSWISTGVYCSAVGYVKKVTGVPEVHAIKMADLSHNPLHERMWPYEVEELRLVLLDLIKPLLPMT